MRTIVILFVVVVFVVCVIVEASCWYWLNVVVMVVRVVIGVSGDRGVVVLLNVLVLLVHLVCSL